MIIIKLQVQVTVKDNELLYSPYLNHKNYPKLLEENEEKSTPFEILILFRMSLGDRTSMTDNLFLGFVKL